MGGESGKKRVVEVEGQEYQPTKAEMEERIKIDASPEDVARSLFSGDPPVVESGRGAESKQEWAAWKERRANGS